MQALDVFLEDIDCITVGGEGESKLRCDVIWIKESTEKGASSAEYSSFFGSALKTSNDIVKLECVSISM